ncbi:hypothetical protein KEM55_002259 [Ascosphaera atra]|nr:hypothetical protein KEM55_002259 [Ascosphaera atra]
MEAKQTPNVPHTELDIAGVAGKATVTLPRITIKFCTQCKWNLRAAYFAQELLQTFSTQLGEVSLMPAAGGVFTITMLYARDGTGGSQSYEEIVLWDRKTQGGFPETKQLKALVRNVIDPTRDLGHVDRALNKARAPEASAQEGSGAGEASGQQSKCEDCK